MARSREPRFILTVDHYRTPNWARQFSQIRFLLRIHTFLEDDNGGLREDHSQQGSSFPLVFPEFLFGSERHCSLVASCLLEAGWTNQGSLEYRRSLYQAFSLANSILEIEKDKNRDNNEFGNIVTIIFRVKKTVKRNNHDELAEARAMREDPKLVPATKKLIRALPKLLKLDGDCMICLEKLVSIQALPCSHLFHEDCIDKWRNTGHRSPLCRYRMPTDARKVEGFYFPH